MKKKFAALAAQFGGSCHYAGATQKPIFEETSTTLKGGVPGKAPVLISTKRLTGFNNTFRTMYVKGMDEQQATAFNKAWGNTPIPFQVIFQ